MAGGVKLATGYIQITAETSQVPQQIKDALNQAGQQAAKPAGQQMGRDIAQGINDGMRSIPSGGGSNQSVISDVIQGKPVSGNVRAQGTKVGKELGTGIQQGVDQAWGTAKGGLGKSIQQSIDPKKTGTQIGKDMGTAIQQSVNESWGKGGPGGGLGSQAGKQIGKDIGAGVNEGLDQSLKDDSPIKIIKDAAKDFGKELTADLKAGDVAAAFDRVGTVAENATTMINNLGHAVGINLDGVEHFGVNVAHTLDNLGGSIQPVVTSLKSAADHVRAALSGDVATRFGAVATALRDLDPIAQRLGVHLGGAADTIQRVADTAQQVRDAKDTLLAVTGGATVASALARLAPAAEVVAPTIAGNWIANQIAPHLPTVSGQPMQQRPWWWAIQQGFQFPVEQWNNLMTSIFGAPSDGYGPAVPAPPAGPASRERMAQMLLGDGEEPQPVKPIPGEGPAAVIQQTITAPPPKVVEVAAPAAGAAQIGHASEQIQSASISVGSASISGVSAPSTSPAPAAAGGPSPSSASKPKSWMDMLPHKEGGPILDDEQNAQLHKGELVVPADVVKDAGGPEAIKGQLTQALAPPTGGGDQASDKNITDIIDAARTAGFIPTGAGSKSVAGTSFVAGLLNLGNEAVGGLIDTGAAAAQTALSMAATAGTFGAGGQAAGALGGIGIQLAASEGKRAASYGFQMASILADSVIDQVFGPFGGPPRWLGYDYTQFVPHINIGAIGTTTVEKAMQAAQGKPGAAPGGPVTPEHMGGEQPVGPPVPKFGTPPAQQSLGGAGPQGQPAPEGAAPPPPPDTGAPPPGPPPESVAAPGALPGPGPATGFDLHNLLGFDEGGWLPPGIGPVNTTGRPELVLSPQQLDDMQTSTRGNPWRGGDTYHITTIDAEGVGREIDKRKRLAMMQYAGRP
jgi:hypothetical protein